MSPNSRPVLIATDKFKGCLSAVEVTRYLAEGITAVRPDVGVVELPIADGGEGTLAAMESVGFIAVPIKVTGAWGWTRKDTHFGKRGTTAIIEVARIAGFSSTATDSDPLTATSYGVGEAILAAMDHGCTEIVVAVGGSATTDGGLGMLRALGARILDRQGDALALDAFTLTRVETVVLSELDRRLHDVTFVLAADVDNPLLGASGAARCFGPQKGATPRQVGLLELGLTRWSSAITTATGRDHTADRAAGAAGGIGFAALATLSARYRSGIDLVLELIDAVGHISGAGLVITGEGNLDSQSLRGKAPLGVARAATTADVPVIAVVGSSSISEEQSTSAGFQRVYQLAHLEPDRATSMANAGSLLVAIGRRIAEDHITARGDTHE